MITHDLLTISLKIEKSDIEISLKKCQKPDFEKKLDFFCNFCNTFFIMKTSSPGFNFYMIMFARV